jgi:hypothetical protein
MLVFVLALSMMALQASTPAVTIPTPAVSAAQDKQNHDFLARAENGLTAFNEDTQYAQYEQPEIKEFAHQLFLCEQPMSPEELDVCTDVLSDMGNSLDALDEKLHHSRVI